MRKKSFIVLMCFMLIFALAAGCSTAEKKPLPNKPQVNNNNAENKNAAPKKPKLRDLHVTTFAMNDTGKLDPLPSLQKYGKNINEISPLWFSVQADGSVKDKTNKAMLDYARKNKIDIVPLVNVAKSNDTVLTDKTARARTIRELTQIMDRYEFAGYNIDFEFLPNGEKDFVKDKDLLTEFIKLLSDQIRQKGKKIDISLIPQYDVSKDVSGIYDYPKLAPLVDHATLMLYDHHQSGSAPGPIAPERWVEENIKLALKSGFKPSQICMGVATYGYDWPLNSTGGFSSPTKDILRKAEQFGVKVEWSDKYHEPYYIYTDPSGTRREVWFESSHTMEQKIRMAKKYNLFGICIWRLGFETPSFWDVISKEVKR